MIYAIPESELSDASTREAIALEILAGDPYYVKAPFLRVRSPLSVDGYMPEEIEPLVNGPHLLGPEMYVLVLGNSETGHIAYGPFADKNRARLFDASFSGGDLPSRVLACKPPSQTLSQDVLLAMAENIDGATMSVPLQNDEGVTVALATARLTYRDGKITAQITPSTLNESPVPAGAFELTQELLFNATHVAASLSVAAPGQMDKPNPEPFVVLYRSSSQKPLDPPLSFSCEAAHGDAAEQQCESAHPGCEVLWVVSGDSVEHAYNDYWGWGAEDEPEDRPLSQAFGA